MSSSTIEAIIGRFSLLSIHDRAQVADRVKSEALVGCVVGTLPLTYTASWSMLLPISATVGDTKAPFQRTCSSTALLSRCRGFVMQSFSCTPISHSVSKRSHRSRAIPQGQNYPETLPKFFMLIDDAAIVTDFRRPTSQLRYNCYR